MTVTGIDWALALMFVSGLVLLLKCRKQLAVRGEGNYNQVVAGVSILGAVEVGRIYEAAGMFSSIDFLSDPTFYQIASWIALLTGLLLLLSGLSKWLPISREYRRYSEERVRRLEFIKKIEQLVSVESRLDALLGSMLGYIKTHFDLSNGAVVKCSFRRGDLSFVHSVGECKMNRSTMFKTAFRPAGWQRFMSGVPANSAGMIDGLDAIHFRPERVLPVVVDRRPAAFFLLGRTEGRALDRDDELCLKTAVDIVARKIDQDQMRLHRDSLLKRTEWAFDLDLAVAAESELTGRIQAMVNSVRQLLDFDLFSLSLVNSRLQVTHRLSAGRSGSVLLELGVGKLEKDRLLDRARQSDEMIAVGDVRRNDLVPDSFMELHVPRSLAALSSAAGELTAVLAIASQKRNAWTRTQLRALQATGVHLGRIASLQETTEQSAVFDRRINRLNNYLSVVGADESIIDYAAYAARLLKEELAADMVRITRVGKIDQTYEQTFLDSLALETSGSRAGMAPEQGTLILSVMPVHQEAFSTGRPVMLAEDTDLSRMQEVELRQVFVPPLKALCIVPINHGNKVIGFADIALGPESGRSRFCNQDILFASTVAETLGLVWRYDNLAAKQDRFSIANSSVSTNRMTGDSKGTVCRPSRIKLTLPAEVQDAVSEPMTSY